MREYCENELTTMSKNDMLIFVEASCRYRTRVIQEWNGRDSDELCGLDEREVEEKTSLYDVCISALVIDEEDRREVLQQLTELRNLAKNQFPRLSGMIKSDPGVNSTFKKLVENELINDSDIKSKSLRKLIVVHAGIHGVYVVGTAKDNCVELTFTAFSDNREEVKYVRPMAMDEKELDAAFLFEDAVRKGAIPEWHLDERYAL